jgi:type II secretory ATPase GspE/PulE/Tfp pilus assembly ATPase PilB-like protein
MGRSTVAEIAIISDEMRRLILAAASEAEIENSAQRLGMISMYENGVTKVLHGETSIDEVLRTVGVKLRIEPSSGKERQLWKD